MGEATGFWSSYNVISRRSGILENVTPDDCLKEFLIEYQTDHKPGDSVKTFENAGQTPGVMVSQYPFMERMLELVEQLPQLVRVELK